MDTKKALLDSAENAVRSFGFDGFSYANLAQDVGIRKASIHYHYPKKADLGLALMQRYAEGMAQHLAQVDGESDTAGKRLYGLVQRYRDGLRDGHQLCLCVALSINPGSLDVELIAELASFRKTTVAWICGVFESGKTDGTIRNVAEPIAEARACLALLEGAHLIARVETKVMLFDDAIASLTARIA